MTRAQRPSSYTTSLPAVSARAFPAAGWRAATRRHLWAMWLTRPWQAIGLITIALPQLYSCVQLTDFTAFKIWEYGIYSEVLLPYINIIGAKVADATVGVSLHLSGANSLAHTVLDAKASIRDSLFVGQSGNGHCSTTKPSLHACKFYMAWCHHLPKHHVGIHILSISRRSNSAPIIKPWWDAGSYPALYGYTEVEDVTFAKFDVPCSQGPRANKRDFALSGIPDKNADAWPPVHTKSIQKVEVAEDSVVFFPDPQAKLDQPGRKCV